MAMDAGWYDVSTNMHPIISSMELIACLFQVIVTEKKKFSIIFLGDSDVSSINV